MNSFVNSPVRLLSLSFFNYTYFNIIRFVMLNNNMYVTV